MEATPYIVENLPEFADVMTIERRRQSITQQELSIRSGVSPQMISAIEHRKREPTLGIVVLLAVALGITLVLGAKKG